MSDGEPSTPNEMKTIQAKEKSMTMKSNFGKTRHLQVKQKTEDSDVMVPSPTSERANNDAFTLYLREIGQTPLITPKEEIELDKRMRKGDKAAREQMIDGQFAAVVKIARDYENYGMPLLDLISEGNIGLMKAVERFDPKKGAKLSTYAAWWIKQMIRRAISDQSKTIRLPVHVGDKLLHIRRAEAKFENEFGRRPHG